jgi:hypothetical protein
VDENFWPDAAKKHHHKFRFQLQGGTPAAAMIHDWGAVFRLDVGEWPGADLGGLRASNARSSASEAYAMGYLYCAEHLWPKDEFTVSYMNRARLPEIAGLTIKPANCLLGTVMPNDNARAGSLTSRRDSAATKI